MDERGDTGEVPPFFFFATPYKSRQGERSTWFSLLLHDPVRICSPVLNDASLSRGSWDGKTVVLVDVIMDSDDKGLECCVFRFLGGQGGEFR